MQQFKTIIGIFTTLLFSILTVTAQDFDPKQGYEIPYRKRIGFR